MRFKLTARECPETGEMGWLDSRISSDAYGPIMGTGLAHDMLEHFAFDSVADEIMAHGAMYWIRYEGGWSSSNGWNLSPDAIGEEWISLYNGLRQDSYMPTPKATRPLDESVEEDISTIMQVGRKTVLGECGWYENAQVTVLEIENAFRAYFRMGYRKARRRYRGLAACEVAGLYSTLAERMERLEPEWEGQEVTVTVSPKTGRVEIHEKELTEY